LSVIQQDLHENTLHIIKLTTCVLCKSQLGGEIFVYSFNSHHSESFNLPMGLYKLRDRKRRRKKGNKKHLKNVGPIRHCEPPHAACFTLPFTRCRYCRTPPLSYAACASMSTTTSTTTTTATTTRDRGDRYGPMERA